MSLKSGKMANAVSSNPQGWLERNCAQLGLSLSSAQIQKLLKYRDLLLKWNKVYSLTAHHEPQAVLVNHVLDGLAVVRSFVGLSPILDVGSGMGVPAIILAIVLPEQQVVALDSNRKKTAFLTQVKIELGLTNLTIVSERVETYQPSQLFQAITSRAFANLQLFVQLSAHLLANNGCYLAMKSNQGLTELTALPEWHNEVIPLQVPHLAKQRFLIKMVRT